MFPVSWGLKLYFGKIIIIIIIMKHFYIAHNKFISKLHVSMRFTEQNTGGMKLCTGFIIVKFYEVLNRCVFKLVSNLSYVSMFLTCSGRLFHNTGAAYENDLSPYDLVIV